MALTGRPSPGRRPARGRTVGATTLLALVLLTAFNLRPAVASIGPVLRELQAALGLSDLLTGILTSMPLLCFGVVGLLSGHLGRWLGTHTAMLVASALLVAGMGLRTVTGSATVFLVASLAALVGLAIGNVLLPVAVRSWFPDRVGTMTGVYTTALMTGAAVAAALTVPAARAFGGWRPAIGVWTIPAVVALALWWFVARRAGEPALAPPGPDPQALDPSGAPAVTLPEPGARMHRSPRAWALAIFLGIQASEAFTLLGWLPTLLREASGVSPTRAGVLLSVTMIVGVPVSMLLSPLTARFPDQRALIVGLLASSAFAYLGLILAPTVAPTLWVVLAGVGIVAYPLALMLIGLRAATDRGTAELSSLVQGVGFLLATVGPLLFGALHERTGGWEVPLWMLVALLVPKLVAGMLVGVPGNLDRPSPAGPGDRQVP